VRNLTGFVVLSVQLRADAELLAQALQFAASALIDEEVSAVGRDAHVTMPGFGFALLEVALEFLLRVVSLITQITFEFEHRPAKKGVRASMDFR
jgi:hypothetical protein